MLKIFWCSMDNHVWDGVGGRRGR